MKHACLSLAAISSLLVAMSVQAHASCTSDTVIQMSGEHDVPWSIAVDIHPDTVLLNQPFDATIHICSKSGDLPDQLKVDATMPAHNHGMNYNPKMSRLADRQYKVENLLFHMPGIWELEVTTLDNGVPHRFTHDLKIQ